jgi:hypothetical protein
MLQFDSQQGQLLGTSGALPLCASDEVTRKLAMLIAGECLGLGPIEAAKAFGYSKQRYFQLRNAFAHQGAAALVNQSPGPGRRYRCTDEAVRQAVRHRFLDPDARIRLVVIRSQFSWPDPDLEARRAARAVEALREIDTPKARALLDDLARGKMGSTWADPARAKLKK